MNDKAKWGCDCGWFTSYDPQSMISWENAMGAYEEHRLTHLLTWNAAYGMIEYGDMESGSWRAQEDEYTFDYARFERRALEIMSADPTIQVKAGRPRPKIEDGDELRAVVEAELVTWEHGRPHSCGCGKHL